MSALEITPTIAVPLAEIELSYARAGGPGGQNVNKVASKAVLRWNVASSTGVPEAIKDRLRAQLRRRITIGGDLWEEENVRPDIRNSVAYELGQLDIPVLICCGNHDPLVTGSDTAAYEVAPSGIEGDPQPVHRHLIQERGIPILEWVNLEDLARDSVYEFLFLCLPLTIRGATGSSVRPLAIV